MKRESQNHLTEDQYNPQKPADFNSTPKPNLNQTYELDKNSKKYENVSSDLCKVQKKREKQGTERINMILIFFVLVGIGYFLSSYRQNPELKLLQGQIQSLQTKSMEWKNEAEHMQKIISSMRFQIDVLQKHSQKLANQIIDIHMGELTKSEKSFSFLKKYSNPIPINFTDTNSPTYLKTFSKNYRKINKNNRIRKISHEQAMMYNVDPISESDMWHFEFKVERTDLGMIAAGVFTESKSKDCGYCESDKMYYIYCQNGKIYHGQSLSYIKYSKESRVRSILSGDVVSVFINNDDHELIWYVNSRFVGSMYLQQADFEEKLHPFILMTTNNDLIELF